MEFIKNKYIVVALMAIASSIVVGYITPFVVRHINEDLVINGVTLPLVLTALIF